MRIAGVTKRFGEVYAVDNISIDIYRGEFFALLGPSGCGKTTLLRMLAGFERPTSGQIWIDGQDMSAVPPWRRPVNMMFQSYALFPHMSVEANVAFGLRQEGVARPEVERRVAEALALVRLDAQARRRPDQLSGGQRQRVALARAIVKRPKLVLLDEPLAALDKKLRERTQFELVNIQESLGITFVIVTHDQEEAMTVSTRMAVMNEGQVVQVGTPSEIYEYPGLALRRRLHRRREHARGAGAGDEPARDAPRTRRRPAARSWPIGRSRPSPARPSGPPCGPRSSSYPQEAPAPDGSPNMMVGTVVDIAYLGDVSIYHVRLESGTIVRATATNRLRLIERPVSWDDRVWLSWRPDASGVLKQ